MMLPMINSIDLTILFYIQSLHDPFLDKLMVFITALGDKGFLWIAIALVLLINKKTRMIGFLTLSALILSTVVGEGIIKHLIQRPRPQVSFPDIQMLIKESSVYSFPSGHTTSSFAAAYILSKYLKKLSWLFWGMASMIAFSRLYLFMHYPSDIVAGVIIGLACGKIIIYGFKANHQS